MEDYIKMGDVKTVELDYIKMVDMAAIEINPEQSSSREKHTPECEAQNQENSECMSLDCRAKDESRQDKGAQNLFQNLQNVGIEKTIDENSDGEIDDLSKWGDRLFEKENEHLGVPLSPESTNEGNLNHLTGTDDGHKMAITTEKQVSNISDMGDYRQLIYDIRHDDASSAELHPKNRHKKEARKLTCTGMTTIDGDKIVIVTESGQILVLRPDGLFLFLKEFDESFGDVATVGSNNIVASCGFRVSFFMVHDTEIQEEKEKCIDFQYEETTVHGISHNAQKLLMSCNLQSVASSDPPALKLYDMKRKVTKTFDNLRFKYPGRVLLSTDASIIYVADQMEKTVTCLDINGRQLWKTVEAKSPTSITLSEDTLLVTIEESEEIKCLLSRNGTISKSIPINGTFLSKAFLLAQNATSIILCPCDYAVDGMSTLVMFSRIKHTRKHDLFAKISRVKLLAKAFR